VARAHTELGIQTLAGIARNSTSDSARVQAVGMLLDRGWGKAPQPHTGEDGNDIRITIRQIIEGDDKSDLSMATHCELDREPAGRKASTGH
jgi:hypothetical protein